MSLDLEQQHKAALEAVTALFSARKNANVLEQRMKGAQEDAKEWKKRYESAVIDLRMAQLSNASILAEKEAMQIRHNRLKYYAGHLEKLRDASDAFVAECSGVMKIERVDPTVVATVVTKGLKRLRETNLPPAHCEKEPPHQKK